MTEVARIIGFAFAPYAFATLIWLLRRWVYWGNNWTDDA